MISVILLGFALVHATSAAEICCGEIGCFNDNPPYDGLPLPDCAVDFDIVYTMYTRSNRVVGQRVDQNTIPSVFNPARRTVFMAHGWNSDGTSAWLHNMKDAFLDREDINAVIVDWGGGAQVLDYPQAASNTRTVGANTALVFQNLLTRSGSSSSRMWCVGHSLGSHMCGHTGMKMPSNQKLGRVTGMDPAGPWFEGNPDKTVGLNPTSAAFVDVIHTDAELGTERDLGHIDFYPDGGTSQPGCFKKANRDYTKLRSDEIDQFDNCSHGRAHAYMIESIKQDCFRSNQQCSNYNNLPGSCTGCTGCGAFPCAFMGYAADSSCKLSGLFYVDVTGSSPYCTN